ncbi:hypothetical protein P4S95_09085 [Aneurinibacillus aneurinilyticus]|uniref:GIY-YIG domain-containing protein n=1 Tax=Aneurinibacillus aneurinilyticus TaxID=1391 RepID=A0A848CXF7_ANEAE|nr:hypothetical protein [Aneurinibacillus aneurinilyticus]MED0670371.1 hypothetical protein [Aneurinibacillus aneurinilyticus]NME98086.1 hypothetical protein [Aneurinibacillus aneurinilyticus]
MRKSIQEFLISKSFLPLDDVNWNSFRIIHNQPKDEEEKSKTRKQICDKTSNKNGLYVYENDRGEILYVGKGKPIKSRLLRHYEKLYRETGEAVRNEFFLANQGKLKIYWKELEQEEDRRIVEQMLDFVLKPKFNEWRKRAQMGKRL